MAAYTGLLTGAGAAGGLETLLTRMREEEEAKRRQQALEAQIGQQGVANQFRNRELSLDEAMAPSQMMGRMAQARAATANAGIDEARLGLLKGFQGQGSVPEDIDVANSPTRLSLRAVGITPDPVTAERTTPEWRARLEGFGPYSPTDVRNAQSSPYADRYYQLAVGREERHARDQQAREQMAKQRFDFAVGEASKRTTDAARLSAFRQGLAKRLSAEVSKPFLGIFGESVDNQIDAIVSEEMAKLDNPVAPTSQDQIPGTIPQGVVVRPRPR